MATSLKQGRCRHHPGVKTVSTEVLIVRSSINSLYNVVEVDYFGETASVLAALVPFEEAQALFKLYASPEQQMEETDTENI